MRRKLQLRARGYADKYRGQAGAVHLVGAELSRRERDIVRFENERA